MSAFKKKLELHRHKAKLTIGIMGKAAMLAEEIIKGRVLEGKNIDGSKFRGYASKTKRIRAEHGRQTSQVDLNFKGEMLRNLRGVGVSGNKGVVGFSDADQLDKAVSITKGGRYFVGLSKKEEQEVTDYILSEIIGDL